MDLLSEICDVIVETTVRLQNLRSRRSKPIGQETYTQHRRNWLGRRPKAEAVVRFLAPARRGAYAPAPSPLHSAIIFEH